MADILPHLAIATGKLAAGKGLTSPPADGRVPS
jgi:hypothetical protein